MNKILFVAAAAIISLSAPIVSAAEKTYIIGFHDKPGHAEKQLIESRKGKIKKTLDVLPVVIADLSDADAGQLRTDRKVAYVEENVVYSVPLQAYSVSTEYPASWGVNHIGAAAAHLRQVTGRGVKIGILDSGIDATHSDLALNYAGGYDFVFSDPIPDDENGHGTHIAGIIGAKANGTGFIGVAPDADIYALRVLDGGGFGSSERLLRAMDWAILNGLNVLNISNGTSLNLQSLQDAFQRAYAAGIVVVAAAGNGLGAPGKDITLLPTYPACYDTVIAVSATDSTDIIASWSNYGTKVELSAPGVNVNSTWIGGGAGILSGTSQAAPHVAGAAALLLSAGVTDANGDGNLVDEVRADLAATSKDLGAPGRDPYYGHGLVDVSWVGDVKPDRFIVAGGATASVARTLPTGIYTIEISNLKLDRIKISRSAATDRTWPMTIRFNGRAPQVTSVDVNITTAEETFSFVPYGAGGTSAIITIRKK